MYQGGMIIMMTTDLLLEPLSDIALARLINAFTKPLTAGYAFYF